VLLSRADYEALEETPRLLRVPVNAGRLIDDALREPATGIGKPEPLRHMLAGTWSRRISEEHRLVRLVNGEDLVVLQARFQYK
jgi:Txe/YoeB family toxin of toxin-antitoxin system